MTRILVEKKEPFRLTERDMLLEIRDVLKIPGISGVRILSGYDVSGIKDIEKAKKAVFSEAGKDIVYDTEPDTSEAVFVFAVTSVIDQYDQREDYSIQLLKLLEPQSEPVVRVFQIIALYGNISENELSKIKAYYINPNEKQEIYTKETKVREYSKASDVEVIKGFSNADDSLLTELSKTYGIAMALDNLRLCRDYYKKENRDPTVTEMKVLDTYWSDHCRHSTFMTVIEDVKVHENKYTAGLERAKKLYELAQDYVYGENKRPLCLMDIATMQMKKLKKSGDLDDMEKSDEVNACSIEVTVPVKTHPESTETKDVDMIVMFKNETHNHPTEMEPFGGASTCLGGAIRDPLSGRAYVYGAIRVTGGADPRETIKDTLPGKLPQRQITQIAADGYSSYGNGIGLPLGQLLEYYDPGFKAKRMECGAVVAAALKSDIVRGKPEAGDIVVLIGGATGRDGCGGATGSSKEHEDDSLEKGGAEVQKGNPVIERNIVRLFRKPNVSKMIKTCNDFGAGGVCVAVGELADGLIIDLDKVHVKYPGLDGTELAISESQERMAVVIKAGDLEKFLEETSKENLTAVKIADVTDSGQIVMNWRGTEILRLNSDFLNSGGVRQSTNVVVAEPDWGYSEIGKVVKGAVKQAWLENLADINVCSKKGIAQQFDSVTGGNTVFMPYGGIYQRTPEMGLAMRLPLLEGETDYGTLMTVGYNPSLGYKSPFHAAMYAVIESVMKITAMGGDYRKVRLSFQEYFEKLSKEESWGKPYAVLMGAFLAQDELGIPAIGGKDSMSGTFNDLSVPPSLISFAVAVADTTKLISRAFKKAGNNVYLLKTPISDGGIPNFGILKDNMGSVQNLVKYGCIKSASVVGMGGIAAAVSEMTFGNEIGFSFDSAFIGSLGSFDKLFTPGYASIILELDVVPKDSDSLRSDFILLGTTTDKKVIKIGEEEIPLEEALIAWEKPLDSVFPVKSTSVVIADSQIAGVVLQDELKAGEKPKVLIPIFPGTTGEYELEKQFKNAGADVRTVLFRNKTQEDIRNSYKELTEAVNGTDILAIPSGMSAGAEPDGSAKLISIILRHTDVKNAVNNLISKRKGLILGLGEGFKALLKTGLLQTELIQDEDPGDIILVNNNTNKHHSTLKTVKIENSDSPWLTSMSGLSETVPISGLETDMSRGDGSCGSQTELMTSKSGLILGRLGLVENLKKGLYSNVFDAKESRIFQNAVDYINGRVL